MLIFIVSTIVLILTNHACGMNKNRCFDSTLTSKESIENIIADNLVEVFTSKEGYLAPPRDIIFILLDYLSYNEIEELKHKEIDELETRPNKNTEFLSMLNIYRVRHSTPSVSLMDVFYKKKEGVKKKIGRNKRGARRRCYEERPLDEIRKIFTNLKYYCSIYKFQGIKLVFETRIYTVNAPGPPRFLYPKSNLLYAARTLTKSVVELVLQYYTTTYTANFPMKAQEIVETLQLLTKLTSLTFTNLKIDTFLGKEWEKLQLKQLRTLVIEFLDGLDDQDIHTILRATPCITHFRLSLFRPEKNYEYITGEKWHNLDAIKNLTTLEIDHMSLKQENLKAILKNATKLVSLKLDTISNEIKSFEDVYLPHLKESNQEFLMLLSKKPEER